MELITKYGTLHGVEKVDYTGNGVVMECTLNEPNELALPYGTFIPKYKETSVRDKFTKSISFYSNGNIRSLALQEQTEFMTPLGKIPAELVTFYESGKIHRIFPLNGKLSGYWSEKDESDLATILTVKTSVSSFDRKINCFHFYENSVLCSVTLWSNELVEVATPDGNILTRIGFALYEDGTLKSLEPAFPVSVMTPIGKIVAYDMSPIGIHADQNSLCYTNEGKVSMITTSTSCLDITELATLKRVRIEPQKKPSQLDISKLTIVPITVLFGNTFVTIIDSDQQTFHYNLADIQCTISSTKKDISTCSGSCESCGQCS
ncbi:MAG TPA: hypothetical protein VHQ24_05335 [Lachnospiraceae bacterium]|nr:hypothetical protein [Lachnospiraceae bacterium]HEX3076267.1 hypothetical protein [Lachnospiraceae bacterium]